MFVVVTYDISDNKRRLHVSNELENFGLRVNLSVFECHLSWEDLADLKRKLAGKIDTGTDKIRYYTLCDSCFKKVDVQGNGEVTQQNDYILV